MRLSLLISILILFSLISGAQGQERTKLHLFKYARTNTDTLKTAFLDFQDLLQEKMPRLASELVDRGDIQIPAVERLMLKPVVDDEGNLRRSPASLEARRKYWHETGALGVLTGYVKQEENAPYIRTTFFWGGLHGPDADETIDLELPVTGDAFDTTDDSHSVATLYALAHEIGRECSQSATTFYLLSEADKRAKAVSNDAPELGSDLQEMVTQAIAALRDRCHD